MNMLDNLKVIRKESKLHTTGYTSVPSEFREIFNIKSGDRIIWEHTYGDGFFKVFIKKKNTK